MLRVDPTSEDAMNNSEDIHMCGGGNNSLGIRIWNVCYLIVEEKYHRMISLWFYLQETCFKIMPHFESDIIFEKLTSYCQVFGTALGYA